MCESTTTTTCMFAYDSITVSYAWELILVSMCYSQGGGVINTLVMYCTHDLLDFLIYLFLPCVIYGVAYCFGCSCRWHGHVLSGTKVIKIMCVHQTHQQG